MAYLLLSLIALAGLLIGAIIGRYTKEELKDFNKYFRMIIPVLFFFTVLAVGITKKIILAPLIISIIFILIKNRIFEDYINFVLLSILFYLSNENELILGLILTYSILYGSLIYYKKESIKLFSLGITFLIIANILLVVGV